MQRSVVARMAGKLPGEFHCCILLEKTRLAGVYTYNTRTNPSSLLARKLFRIPTQEYLDSLQRYSNPEFLNYFPGIPMEASKMQLLYKVINCPE